MGGLVLGGQILEGIGQAGGGGHQHLARHGGDHDAGQDASKEGTAKRHENPLSVRMGAWIPEYRNTDRNIYRYIPISGIMQDFAQVLMQVT
jgi:hypothetical protein